MSFSPCSIVASQSKASTRVWLRTREQKATILNTRTKWGSTCRSRKSSHKPVSVAGRSTLFEPINTTSTKGLIYSQFITAQKVIWTRIHKNMSVHMSLLILQTPSLSKTSRCRQCLPSRSRTISYHLKTPSIQTCLFQSNTQSFHSSWPTQATLIRLGPSGRRNPLNFQ